jgi:hypothetical protein
MVRAETEKWDVRPVGDKSGRWYVARMVGGVEGVWEAVVSTTKATARQIAREHNTHAALVEALERAADVLSGYPATSAACDEAANDARAALAAAKAVQP